MSMTNRELIEAYVNDPDPDFNKGVRRANSLFCHSGVLHSYAEPIAMYKDGVFTVSRKKWSLTTTRHQNTLLGILAQQGKTYTITQERIT